MSKVGDKSYRLKLLNVLLNISKVNNKDTRITLLTSIQHGHNEYHLPAKNMQEIHKNNTNNLGKC